MIIVGGASIVLNYGFRMTTMDIDCTDENKILMNDVVNYVAEKHQLPFSWINTSFMSTNSYSPKIAQYSSFYKNYGGVLNVRTIKDEYLLAMKVVSGRKYKNDFSDIYGIILNCNDSGKRITLEKLNNAIINLYGTLEAVDSDAMEFAIKTIENPVEIPYEEIIGAEENNAKLVKAKLSNNMDQADVDYIISKLEID